MRIRARHYATGHRIDVVCERGAISSVGVPTLDRPDREAGWVAPAMFDLQINGCDRIGFSSAQLTAENVRHVVDVCRTHGISGLCPTLITNSFEALAHGMATLRKACESDSVVGRAVPALHLEGP